VGEFIQPVGEAISGAENFLGDATFKATGSPALAAAATALPTAIGEALGFAAGKGVLKTGQAINTSRITKAIAESAPSTNRLFSTSRSIFKEIDDLGASVKPDAYRTLVNKLTKQARKSGLDKDVTPKSANALARFQDNIKSSRITARDLDTPRSAESLARLVKERLEGKPVTLSELDRLRTIAQGAAKSLEKTDSAISTQMINTIDDFLDNAGTSVIDLPPGSPNIGKRYKAARDLWGRGRRSELLQESFDKARLQASGFENGIRVQFRSILNNPKKRRFFKPGEISAMKKVVQGGKGENLAKLIGRFGFSEGQATNIIGGSIAAGVGASLGGVPGAIALPLIGGASRRLAQKLTRNNAEFVDQLVRSGSDARLITETYLKSTTRKNRSAGELSELLLTKNADLSDLPGTPLAREAARIAAERRATLGSAAAGGVLVPDNQSR